MFRYFQWSKCVQSVYKVCSEHGDVNMDIEYSDDVGRNILDILG